MKWRRKRVHLEDLDDSEVMEIVQKGDVEAFGVLVLRFQNPLLNFFRRLGVYTDAEDLIQETFMRVYKRRKTYRPTAKFSTYLYTVARSVWVDWVRRQSRRDANLEKYSEHLATKNTGNNDPSESVLEVQAAVDSLPEKLRLVVVMSVYQGLKYNEIAEVLDIPVGTVKSRMFLAIGKLKECMHARIETDRPTY